MQVSMGKKISLRLDTDLVERLEDYALRERVPVSFVLRHLVIRFLEQRSPSPWQPLHSPPVGVAGMQAATADVSPRGNGKQAAIAASVPSRPVVAEWRRDLPNVDKFEADFRAAACSLFDGFIAAGLDVKEATKRTNFALKDKKHPWATFDIVSKALRDAGRFRKAGRRGAGNVPK